jgi:broad specificity phosphatase PhoE
MTTRLSLLCHAPTAAHRAIAFPADEPLDLQAHERLSKLSHRLHADRILTSPAKRARQTAEALKLEAAVEPLLCDCDYGRWTGRSIDDIRAEDPQGLDAWMRDPAAAPHGGESLLQLIERAASWLDAQNVTPNRTLVVTHASVVRAAVLHAIGAGPQSFWRIDIAPLYLVRLSGNSGRWNFTSLGPALA